MARLSAGLLLEASERTAIGEDRLTEVLAAVLGGDDALLRQVLIESKNADAAAWDWDRHVVSTQRHLRGVGRVDLDVQLYKGPLLVGVLWVENKWRAGFGERQLVKYADELARRHPKLGLVLIITQVGDYVPTPVAEGRGDLIWTPLTWQQVAQAADEVGRAERGPRWRREALSASAAARERHRLELIALLEREGLAHMEPLTNLDVVVARRGNDVLHRVVPELMKQAVEAIETLVRVRAPREQGWNRTWGLGVQWLRLPGPEPAHDRQPRRLG